MIRYALLLAVGALSLSCASSSGRSTSDGEPQDEAVAQVGPESGLHSVRYEVRCGRRCRVTYRDSTGQESTLHVGIRVRPSPWTAEFSVDRETVLEVSASWIDDLETYADLYPFGGGLAVSITVNDTLVVSKENRGPTQLIVAARYTVECQCNDRSRR